MYFIVFAVLRYLVLIKTGAVSGGSGNGGVCSISLSGTKGDTGQQLLTRSLTSPADSMKEGHLDVYMLEAVSVGEITDIRLCFEGKGRGKLF